MRVEACNLWKESQFHIGVLWFTYVSFSFSGEQEESFVDASKGESALEHDLQVGSLQTEELDNDVQKPEEVSFIFPIFATSQVFVFPFLAFLMFIFLNDISVVYFSDYDMNILV